jgi:hypothetical protein
MTITQQCTRCGVTKSSLEFLKNPLHNDILYKNCISCTEKQKTYRKKHKNESKIARQTYYKKNKEKIIKIRQKRFDTLNGRLKNILSNIKNRSKFHEYDLDIDFLISLFKSQNGKCALTNIEMSLTNKSNHRSDPFVVSVDRINPSIGYLKSNVRLVCTVVNYALNEFGEDVFQTICIAYIQQLQKKKISQETF